LRHGVELIYNLMTLYRSFERNNSVRRTDRQSEPKTPSRSTHSSAIPTRNKRFSCCRQEPRDASFQLKTLFKLILGNITVDNDSLTDRHPRMQ